MNLHQIKPIEGINNIRSIWVHPQKHQKQGRKE